MLPKTSPKKQIMKTTTTKEKVSKGYALLKKWKTQDEARFARSIPTAAEIALKTKRYQNRRYRIRKLGVAILNETPNRDFRKLDLPTQKFLSEVKDFCLGQ